MIERKLFSMASHNEKPIQTGNIHIPMKTNENHGINNYLGLNNSEMNENHSLNTTDSIYLQNFKLPTKFDHTADQSQNSQYHLTNQLKPSYIFPQHQNDGSNETIPSLFSYSDSTSSHSTNTSNNKIPTVSTSSYLTGFPANSYPQDMGLHSFSKNVQSQYPPQYQWQQSDQQQYQQHYSQQQLTQQQYTQQQYPQKQYQQQQYPQQYSQKQQYTQQYQQVPYIQQYQQQLQQQYQQQPRHQYLQQNQSQSSSGENSNFTGIPVNSIQQTSPSNLEQSITNRYMNPHPEYNKYYYYKSHLQQDPPVSAKNNPSIPQFNFSKLPIEQHNPLNTQLNLQISHQNGVYTKNNYANKSVSMIDAGNNRCVKVDYKDVSKLTYEVSKNMLMPPFKIYKPSGASLKDQRPKRSKRKSKFTKEQDQMIIDMKNNDKSWVEIAEASKVDSYLAARNRYQVLIGQQGGGSGECSPEDVMMLRDIVDDGETEKMKYLSREFRKCTGKICNYKQIRELLRYLFWKNPGMFDVNSSYLTELKRLQKLRQDEFGNNGLRDDNDGCINVKEEDSANEGVDDKDTNQLLDNHDNSGELTIASNQFDDEGDELEVYDSNEKEEYDHNYGDDCDDDGNYDKYM